MQFISEYLWPKYASEHWLTQINAGYDGCVVCQKHFPVRDISHESIFAITPASDSPDSWTSLGWQNWGEQKQGTSPGGMETWVTLEQEVLWQYTHEGETSSTSHKTVCTFLQNRIEQNSVRILIERLLKVTPPVQDILSGRERQQKCLICRQEGWA